MLKKITNYAIALILLLGYAGSSQAEWWEDETRPTNGRLSFKDKEWYEKTENLNSNEVILEDLDKDGDPDILIYKDTGITVMVIDDNDDMTFNDNRGDVIDDCFVIDYDGDGLVDRIVDYIDNNKDGVPDEMDIRYLDKGQLKWAWFWEDKDNDGLMFDIRNYEYGSAWESDMSGDNLFYANKYDATENNWKPFGEAPFAFYDLDKDNKSESVLRICATPTGYKNIKINKQIFHTDSKALLFELSKHDVDYCNNLDHYFSNTLPEPLDIEVTNLRFSYSLTDDLVGSSKYPYAYDFGFTLSGDAKYQGEQYEHFNRFRRSPKTTKRMSWEDGRSYFDNYTAKQTGFSWAEARLRKRPPAWEGVFWTWERRIINNTGGKTLKYNVRREFDNNVSNKRRIYYSPVDKRIHMFGAEEGWLEVSDPIEQDKKIAEIRYFDIDKDGYFDRWEYDLDNDGVPDRTASVTNSNNEMMTIDYPSLKNRYNNSILPESIELNLAIIKAITKDLKGIIQETNTMKRLGLWLKENPRNTTEKRLYSEILREHYFRVFVNHIRSFNREIYPPPYTAAEKFNTHLLEKSKTHWKLAIGITEFESLYSQGDLNKALIKLEALSESIKKIRLSLKDDQAGS